MKKLIITLFALLVVLKSHGMSGYELSCGSQQDSFVAEINTMTSSLFFKETRNFSINVDDRIFSAKISKNVVFVESEITTYDYFNGHIKFYLGKGLSKTRQNDRIKIAIDADDGDGYSFEKRIYNCRVKQLSIPSDLPGVNISLSDDCYTAAVEIARGISQSYKQYDGKAAKILDLSLERATEKRVYDLTTDDGCIDTYKITLSNDSAFKCSIEHISITQTCG